jgi:hypothetical protein
LKKKEFGLMAHYLYTARDYIKSFNMKARVHIYIQYLRNARSYSNGQRTTHCSPQISLNPYL